MVKKQKRVALYVRVSTDRQTTVNQKLELEKAAARHEWQVVATFEDQGISGAKGRDKRPAWKALWQAVSRREFDMVAAWSIDRLGRNLKELIDFIEELKAKNVDLYLDKQGVDTTTPAGKMALQMFGAIAEYQRGQTIERVHAGLARARAEGKKLGRPTVSAEIEAKILALREQKMGINKIARQIGVGVATVQRVVKPTP
jgi:DNA invertase Pin-like site-specific DNA recombinase